jgi:septal ring factor EnvC (AmiA/AmiB activator)
MRPHPGLFTRVLVVALAAAGASAALAGPKDDLKQLRGRLDRLQRQLAESEDSRSEAADALRASEQAISDSNRRLFELDAKQREARMQLSQLQVDRQRLRREIDAHQVDLARQLYRRYVAGQPEPLRLLAAEQDPNALARRLHYLSYVHRARAQSIAVLRRDMGTLDELSLRARAKGEEVARLQEEQAQTRKRLEQEKRARAAVLARVSEGIAAQRKEIGRLKRDEERLQKLVQRLAEELRARQARRAAKPGAVLRNELIPEDEGDGRAFRDMKGRLRLPVVGDLANRFGSPRADSGVSWKGLFITAQSGTQVRAVAAGRVVFSDWLRGFGNLLIVEHGGGYMTLYANNEALYKQLGDSVKTGEVIASVGASGGNAESGLYFEIRYQGKPFDPLGWVTLK